MTNDEVQMPNQAQNTNGMNRAGTRPAPTGIYVEAGFTGMLISDECGLSISAPRVPGFVQLGELHEHSV
jgi:hypothetical protein